MGERRCSDCNRSLSPASRHLLPGETVHHRNGVRDDNRPEDLELRTRPQPSGIRASDAVVWARQVLDRYGHLDLDARQGPYDGPSGPS